MLGDNEESIQTIINIIENIDSLKDHHWFINSNLTLIIVKLLYSFLNIW